MSNFDALKQQVYECNMALERHGVVIFTFGNASGIDREQGVFAIKPSGVPYDQLKPSDMVIVDMEGKIVEGRLRPSSDTGTHRVLYSAFPGIGGVVHTHSTYAVAWAQAVTPLPVLGTTHADHLHMEVPCTDIMPDDMIRGNYEIETGNQIVRTFQEKSIDPEEVCMVLVGGHGPFAWGKTPEKAVYNSVILEELAQMGYYTRQINPAVPPLKESLIQKHYQRKHGPDAYYGQSDK